jgi:hypothetical protein
MSIALWANIRNFLCGMTMMAEKEIFGMCVQCHGNITMSAFPSMRTITTNIRFVGSSTIEIDENVVCCLSKDSFYLLNGCNRKNAVFYGHEVSIDYRDAFGNCRKTPIFVGFLLFSPHMMASGVR